ncbi:MAG TPA: lipopolysaccharide heptosyltransferase II [Xanthobacteraceae bacterium]|nr:lipopolysaccharide heptosyltransferase II [Xanthobacteraceae bacterium]
MDASDLRTRDFRRILLIKLSAVGDVVHTIPVLNKLRRRYPSARIDWLVTPAIGELIRHHPGVSNVILFSRHDWSTPWRPAALGRIAKLAAELRRTRYDLIVDMHGQFRTAFFALAAGAPVRIGFDRPRAEVWSASERTFPAEAYKHAWKGAREHSWLAYTHRIAVPSLDVHAVDRYLSVGPMLGLDDGPADFSFPVPAAAAARTEALLRANGIATGSPVLLCAPGTNWETKHWRAERFAEVARHFLKRGWRIVLIGSERERAVCARVAAAAPGTVDLCAQTALTELAALVRRSDGCITNDSGPMHLAVALDRPVVSVFGPTDALWIGPYGRPDAVLRADLPCAPCYLRELRHCRHGHACMEEITAAAVIARMEATLADARAEALQPVRREVPAPG